MGKIGEEVIYAESLGLSPWLAHKSQHPHDRLRRPEPILIPDRGLAFLVEGRFAKDKLRLFSECLELGPLGPVLSGGLAHQTPGSLFRLLSTRKFLEVGTR